jgi:hypothetical protein
MNAARCSVSPCRPSEQNFLPVSRRASLNDGVELLPREEVALLLGSLTACGVLVLGILDVLWPPAPRGRAISRPSFQPPAAVPAVVQPPTPREVLLPPRPSPLAVGGLLLERACAEADLERRVTILTRAVAGLTRSAHAAPEDAELTAMLATARELLWETWERIALARLAAAMPWGAATLTAPPRAPRVAALATSA